LTTQSQYIVYLSSTHEGAVDDKKIADEDEAVFP
jgi:hypothetical protein